LYEEIYERSLFRELSLEGLLVERQMTLPLVYRGEVIGDALRVDLLVEKRVVVEVKAISSRQPIHESQLLTYLRLTGCRTGLLINFDERVLTDGVKRLVL
jgi:GxxExxY protein